MRKILVLLLITPSLLQANVTEKQWMLRYGTVGASGTKVELGEGKFEFKNSNGQECWVSPITKQGDTEDRSVICKIDSKNTVATTLACWNSNDQRERSFALNNEDMAKSHTAAFVILSCSSKAK